MHLEEPQYEIINGDIMVTGALPSSGGVLALHRRLCAQQEHAPVMSMHLPIENSSDSSTEQCREAVISMGGAVPVRGPCEEEMAASSGRRRLSSPLQRIEFYKSWDEWGALSNFSPHPISMPRCFGHCQKPCTLCQWPSVEHYYQAQKFTHPEAESDTALVERAAKVVDNILAAPSPEEAAREGRQQERCCPELVRKDWPTAKIDVMHAALRAKFHRHAGPRQMLLSTAVKSDSMLVEASPSDMFWGCGHDGTGKNMLGHLLMSVREELRTTPTQLQTGGQGIPG